MRCVATTLILHPRFVFPMRGVVNLLFHQCLVLQPPNDSPMVSAAFRASGHSPLSGKQLLAVALDERVSRHPGEDRTPFHILSFVVPSCAFNNLQTSHPLSLQVGACWLKHLVEVKPCNRIASGCKITLNN